MKSEESALLRSTTYKYSPENAAIYSRLGVTGTTYEVSFNETRKLLGNVNGKVVLDYGAGAGRSTELILTFGAKEVIGVDQDENMINEALKKKKENMVFKLIKDNTIPLDDEFVDAAVAAHVWVEMKSIQAMQKSADEIYRVLKKGGILVVVTTSPYSIGQDYVSYRYERVNNLRSGDPITCVVKGEKEFKIDDTYWTEEDSLKVLHNAGFKELAVSYPICNGKGWLDETKVAPDMVISAKK